MASPSPTGKTPIAPQSKGDSEVVDSEWSIANADSNALTLGNQPPPPSHQSRAPIEAVFYVADGARDRMTNVQGPNTPFPATAYENQSRGDLEVAAPDPHGVMVEFVADLIRAEFGQEIALHEVTPAGRGAFSYAFSAHSERYGPVVIKVVNPLSTNRDNETYEYRVAAYEREFASLTTAHAEGCLCPRPFQVGRMGYPASDGGPPYIIMERMFGTPLMQNDPRATSWYQDFGAQVARLHSLTSDYYQVFEHSGMRPERSKTVVLLGELSPWRLQSLVRDNLISERDCRYAESLLPHALQDPLAPTLNHCDLGLQNILVNSNGRVGILDWAFARFLPGGALDLARVWQGTLMVDRALGIQLWNNFLDGYIAHCRTPFSANINSLRFQMLFTAGESMRWYLTHPKHPKDPYPHRVQESLEALVTGRDVRLVGYA